MEWMVRKFIFLARLKDQPRAWDYNLKRGKSRIGTLLKNKAGKALNRYIAFLPRKDIQLEWQAAKADTGHLSRELGWGKQLWMAVYYQMFHRARPIDYVLGWTPFMGQRFVVRRPILIPRFDSEIWLKTLISCLKKGGKLRILEAGTGTGCLAISLIKNVPTVEITAIDISPTALWLARHNAKVLLTVEEQRRLIFRRQDIFQLDTSAIEKAFDLIICNPPYIPRSQHMTHTSPSVRRWESPWALLGTSGEIVNGTAFHCHLLKIGPNQSYNADGIQSSLVPHVALELNGSREQAILVQKLALAYGYRKWELVKDEESRPRAIFAYR